MPSTAMDKAGMISVALWVIVESETDLLSNLYTMEEYSMLFTRVPD